MQNLPAPAVRGSLRVQTEHGLGAALGYLSPDGAPLMPRIPPFVRRAPPSQQPQSAATHTRTRSDFSFGGGVGANTLTSSDIGPGGPPAGVPALPASWLATSLCTACNHACCGGLELPGRSSPALRHVMQAGQVEGVSDVRAFAGPSHAETPHNFCAHSAAGKLLQPASATCWQSGVGCIIPSPAFRHMQAEASWTSVFMTACRTSAAHLQHGCGLSNHL